MSISKTTFINSGGGPIDGPSTTNSTTNQRNVTVNNLSLVTHGNSFDLCNKSISKFNSSPRDVCINNNKSCVKERLELLRNELSELKSSSFISKFFSKHFGNYNETKEKLKSDIADCQNQLLNTVGLDNNLRANKTSATKFANRLENYYNDSLSRKLETLSTSIAKKRTDGKNIKKPEAAAKQMLTDADKVGRLLDKNDAILKKVSMIPAGIKMLKGYLSKDSKDTEKILVVLRGVSSILNDITPPNMKTQQQTITKQINLAIGIAEQIIALNKIPGSNDQNTETNDLMKQLNTLLNQIVA